MIDIVASVKVRPNQSLRVKPKEAGTSKNSVNRMLMKQKTRHFKSKLVYNQVIINKIKTGLSTTLPNILILVIESVLLPMNLRLLGMYRQVDIGLFI